MNKTMQKLGLLAIVGSILGITPAVAQKQSAPEGGPPKAFTVPPNETYTLPNGMKVALVPYGIIPKAAIRLSVDAAEINEGTSRVGVASLTTDLMKEGTENLSAQKVAEAAARMGSTLEVHAGNDQTKLGIDVLQEFAPEAVKLLADVAQHPLLPQSEIDRLKNDALRQIALQNSQPQTIVLTRFRKILYRDHRYELTSRRIIQFAHHCEYPRAEGLHLFPSQRNLAPLSRRVLGGNSGRNHTIHGAFPEGNSWRGHTDAEGTCQRNRAKGNTKLPFGNLRNPEFQPQCPDRPS